MREADFWFPEDKSELDVHRMCTFSVSSGDGERYGKMVLF